MKKIINLFLVISSLVFITTVSYIYFYKNVRTSAVDVPIQFIDIGTRKPDESINLTFEIKNISDVNFKIEKVEADCHCSVPKWTQEEILKNETTFIVVQYNNDNIGYFQQSVKVYCNTENSPIILTLQGKTEN